tara:strand:- start:255 stop:1148 length:894 start_codon:yes stop_codon:yes gene_type:complete
MANETEMMLVDISNPSIPLFTKQVSNPQQIGFVSDEKIVILQEGVISYFDYEGNLSTGVQPLGTESVSIIETSGDKIAMVFEDSPDTVHIGYVDSEGLISTKINATANEIEDEILEDLDKIVDIENATITDISLYDEYLAAVVDVNATTRLVLLDTSSGDSFIVSDPKYGAFDPHMDYGILMFAAFQNIDPENASSEKYSDLEIMIHDLTTNLTTPLTADSIDQWAPKVLENHYVFQQSKGNGKSSVEVQPKEPALQTYSSNVLKIGVMLMIVLVFINVLQRQKESGSSHRDTVLES